MGRAVSPPLTAENNYATKSPLVTMGCLTFTPTLPLPSTIFTPSNTPIPRPTPLTTPKGIQIQSAILPQYTLHTDWRQVCTKSHLRLIVSDTAENYLMLSVFVELAFFTPCWVMQVTQWTWPLRAQMEHVFTGQMHLLLPNQQCQSIKIEFHLDWCNCPHKKLKPLCKLDTTTTTALQATCLQKAEHEKQKK